MKLKKVNSNTPVTHNSKIARVMYLPLFTGFAGVGVDVGVLLGLVMTYFNTGGVSKV